MSHGRAVQKGSGLKDNPYAFGKTARSAERVRARALGKLPSRRARFALDVENDSRFWGLVVLRAHLLGWWLLHSVGAVCFMRAVWLFVFYRTLTFEDLLNKT